MKDYIVTFTETGDWEMIEAKNATEAHQKGMEIFDAFYDEIEVREWRGCYVQ